MLRSFTEILLQPLKEERQTALFKDAFCTAQ
jgi:hypothetical protein